MLAGSKEDEEFRRNKKKSKEEEEKYLNVEPTHLTPLFTRDTQKEDSAYLDVGSMRGSRAPGSCPGSWWTSSSSRSTCTAPQPSYRGQEGISPPDLTNGGTLCAQNCRADSCTREKTTNETVCFLLTDQCERAREPADGANLVESRGITPDRDAPATSPSAAL